MTTTKERMYDRIRQHGENLLAIFPLAAEQDPVKLCKKLRRLEAQASAFALRMCNGPEWESEQEREADRERILDRVDSLLDFRQLEVPVFLNGDPRGYSLKIRESWMSEHNAVLHRDWGGYGILAPDLKGE